MAFIISADLHRMKILALSDKLVPFIYSSQLRSRFSGTDLVLGCGDLPYYYLEFVLDSLDIPLFFVRGNHDVLVEHSSEAQRTKPDGATDLHARHARYCGLMLAGVEGSHKYREGPFQYTQTGMWRHVFWLVPGLFRNRLAHGRYLDIFITHSPPMGMHDQVDLPHQGIKAFRWLVDSFQPAYYFHGHVHIIGTAENVVGQIGRTRVINSFGYHEIEFDHSLPDLS